MSRLGTNTEPPVRLKYDIHRGAELTCLRDWPPVVPRYEFRRCQARWCEVDVRPICHVPSNLTEISFVHHVSCALDAFHMRVLRR